MYHDWNDQLISLGATLEASQNLGCGVYGVVGYNLLDGAGANDAAVFGETGVFLRLDIVFDEEWTCGEGSITGHTFIDHNANGIRDANELGLAGLKIDLLSDLGQKLQTTYSGEAGSYQFKLNPGRYTLQIALPKGYMFAPASAGNDRSIDSDINATGQSDSLELGWSQHLTAIDIGILTQGR
jgi:SdrD B-like domain